MRKFLVGALAGVLLLSGAVTGASQGGGAHEAFEAVQPPLEVMEALRAQGRSIPYAMFPSSRGKGIPHHTPAEPATYDIADPGSELKVMVLLVDFPDGAPGVTEPPTDPHLFDDLIFGDSYDPYDAATHAAWAAQGHVIPTNNTMKNYYLEVSEGKALIVPGQQSIGEIGWLMMPHPYSYYALGDGLHDYGFGAYPNNVQGLVIDALEAAHAAGMDFTEYANADGRVPNVFVVHRGTGAEWNVDPDIIWSHKWELSSGTPFADGYTIGGVTFDTYSMEPEVGGDLTGYLGAVTGPYPPTVGVYAHEFGHVLNLPDLYDTIGLSEGAGNYDLMAGGSWMRYPNHPMFNGNMPIHPGAWSKVMMGWREPRIVTGKETITLQPVSAGGEIIKMAVPGSGGTEYFLIENRQQLGFDQGFSRNGAPAGVYAPSHGLVIWHVDDAVLNQTGIDRPLYWSNTPNTSPMTRRYNWQQNPTGLNGFNHYGVAVVQADGSYDLENGLNRGDPADFFPGTTGNTAFSLATKVNSSSYYFWPGSGSSGDSGISITNIRENADGSVTATFATSGRNGK